MSYKCAKCEKGIKKTQASLFHRFEHYHLSCFNFNKNHMAQTIRK